MKTKATRNGLTDDVLRDQYGSGKTAREIGDQFGMTEGGVLYRLKKLGIARVSNHERNEARMVSTSGKSIFSLTGEELEAMLRERGERSIANEYGCSRQVLKTLRDKFGIKAYSKTDRIEMICSDSFSEEQLSVIYGSVLGDGNIHLNNTGETARFKETHSMKQSEYLNWKAGIFDEFVAKRGVKETGSKVWHDGRQFYSVLMLTKFHRNFKVIYDWFYDSNGVKHLPDNFADMITPLALAVWYMDDGSMHGTKPTLPSCFSRDDVERACRVIEEKFGIPYYIPDKKSCDSVWVMHFDGDRFFDVIGDYIIPGMAYKAPLKRRFGLKCIGRPELAEYLSMKNIPVNDANIGELVDYLHICGFPYPDVNDFSRSEIVEKIRNSSQLIEGNVIRSGNGIGNDFLVSCFQNFFLSHSYGKWSAKWHFDNNLACILRELQRSRRYVTPANLRSVMTDLAGVYGFRPVVAKQIYDRYCPDNAAVLDPCGGWGGRMLGAYCSDKVARYDCIDACAETKHGLQHVKMLMDRTVPGKDVNVFFGAYEDKDFDPCCYDMVFTSPPYYIKEYYSDDDEQSAKRYGDSFDHWTEGFLKPFAKRSHAWLKPGGKFVVNIGNIVTGRDWFKIADFFYDMMTDEPEFYGKFRFVEELRMMKNDRYGNGRSEYEPVYVFEKI